MEFDFENQRLANELSRGNVSLKLAWLVALNQLSSGGISLEERKRITLACPEPRFAIRFAHLLTPRSGKADVQNDLSDWFKLIETSDFPDAEWYRSLDACFSWLEDHGRTASFRQLMGYLECAASACSQSVETSSFPDCVSGFLSRHGIQIS